jgi:transposase
VDGVGTHEVSARVRNETKAITALVRSWMKKNGLDPAASLFCLEPTGHYSHLLLTVLVGLNVPVWLAHPMDIKQGMGIARGKSDKVDAVPKLARASRSCVTPTRARVSKNGSGARLSR